MKQIFKNIEIKEKINHKNDKDQWINLFYE